jgi:hypothetical protein
MGVAVALAVGEAERERRGAIVARARTLAWPWGRCEGSVLDLA